MFLRVPWGRGDLKPTFSVEGGGKEDTARQTATGKTSCRRVAGKGRKRKWVVAGNPSPGEALSWDLVLSAAISVGLDLIIAGRTSPGSTGLYFRISSQQCKSSNQEVIYYGEKKPWLGIQSARLLGTKNGMCMLYWVHMPCNCKHQLSDNEGGPEGV